MSRPPLKPGTALLLEGLRRHAGAGEVVSPFVAHKVVYFLQKMGGPYGRGVTFAGGPHGPLSPLVDVAVRKLVGSYLVALPLPPGVRRGSLFRLSGIDPAAYPIVQRYLTEHVTPEHLRLLDHLDDLLRDFRAVPDLELLSAVHLVRTFYTHDNLGQITEVTRGWLRRPTEQLRRRQVEAAARRLDRFAGLLAFGR